MPADNTVTVTMSTGAAQEALNGIGALERTEASTEAYEAMQDALTVAEVVASEGLPKGAGTTTEAGTAKEGYPPPICPSCGHRTLEYTQDLPVTYNVIGIEDANPAEVPPLSTLILSSESRSEGPPRDDDCLECFDCGYIEESVRRYIKFA